MDSESEPPGGAIPQDPAVEALGRISTIDTLLGERIRQVRRAHQLSLKDLAQASNISIGLLSQVERGLSSPSVRVLASLAQALQISLGSLFEESVAPPTAEGEFIVRADQRKTLAFWRTGMIKELMTPKSDLRGLDMFMVTISPGGTTGAHAYSHDGLDAGFVLEGTVAINIDRHEYELRPGDSFGFPSTLPHSFRNPDKVVARVIWLNALPACGGSKQRDEKT